MWIRTQTKQRIINSDQIVDIFISKTGTTIFAETTLDNSRDFFVLGEYKDRKTCLLVLDELLEEMKMLCTVYDMPTQEVIDDGYFSSDCQA